MDDTEAQSGKRVRAFSFCPAYEAIFEDCYDCKYVFFDINDPDYADIGDCCHPNERHEGSIETALTRKETKPKEMET